MRAALLLAGLCVFAAGAAGALAIGQRRAWARTIPYLAGMAGSACLVTVGVLATLGPADTVRLGRLFDIGASALRIDGLAGLFLTLTSGLGVAISSCAVSWAHRSERAPGRGSGAGYLLLLGSVAVVIVAGDAFSFLFAWETLSISFFVLVGATRARSSQAAASWMTLAIGKLGGAALLLGFLLLAGQAGSFTLSAWGAVSPGALRGAAYALLVLGFGVKVGVVPFQAWMPTGYPAASGPLRAAMAGLAVNAGFYGLWRFFAILGRPPLALVVAVLALGAVTALLGAVFAAAQSNLNRVIAYSSVENGGLILVGYGVALTGATIGRPALVAVGLLAATLQTLAHAVAKSALFVTAGYAESELGTADLEQVGGFGRTHRWSGFAFGSGALTLAGLPPTIGFVSEWFLLEALLQQFRLHQLPLRLAMAGAGALVALTAGVAALVFVRLLGLTVLGPSRPGGSPARASTEPDLTRRAGLLSLALGCWGLALAAPSVIRFVARGLGPVVAPQVTSGALSSPWVLQPVFSSFSILSPTWLYVVGAVGLAAVGLGSLALSRGRLLRVRRVPAWRSAGGGVSGPDHYSPFAYANVLRHVLSNVLGTQQTLEVIEEARTPGHSAHAHVEHRVVLTEPVESYLYRPVSRAFLRVATWVTRLQSGRLDAYVAYMLVVLIAVLVTAAIMA